ncbi:MAG: ABC transporter permease [Proteobacteria bacterium]|nr:ABC transporter permease [Pseudomonadota bacterium]
MNSISIFGIYAVWHRNLRLYLKTWFINCLPPLFEPITYLFAFAIGMSPMIKELAYFGKQVSYAEFILPGMMGIGVITQGFTEGAYGIFVRIRYQRTWHAMLTAPLTINDIFFGEIFWAATKALLSSALTALVGIIFNIYSFQAYCTAFPAILIACVLFAAMGALTAGVIISIDQINVPMFLFIVPMSVICGTYFPRSGLPSTFKTFVDFLPLSPLIDLCRNHLAPAENSFVCYVVLVSWLVFSLFSARYFLIRKILK